MKTRKSWLALALAVVTLSLSLCTGCLDGTPLDRYSYVTSIGLDEGETYKYNVTFQIQQEGLSETSLEGAGESLISVEGDTIIDALGIANVSFPYQLDFSRTNSFVLSDKVASADFMGDISDALIASLHIRRSARLVVVMGKAREYYEGLDLSVNPNIAKQQSNIIENYYDEGMTSISNLSLFFEGVKNGRFDPVVSLGRIDTTAAKLKQNERTNSASEESAKDGRESKDETTAGIKRTGGTATYVLGSAVFCGARLAGTLNEFDTMMLNIMRGNDVTVRVPYPCENGIVSFRLTRAEKPDVRMQLWPQPSAAVSIRLSGDIELDTTGDAAQRWEDELKGKLEEYLALQMESVFLKLKLLNSDAVGFGRYAAMQFLTVPEWESYGWKERYRELEADYSVRVELFSNPNT